MKKMFNSYAEQKRQEEMQKQREEQDKYERQLRRRETLAMKYKQRNDSNSPDQRGALDRSRPGLKQGVSSSLLAPRMKSQRLSNLQLSKGNSAERNRSSGSQNRGAKTDPRDPKRLLRFDKHPQVD